MLFKQWANFFHFVRGDKKTFRKDYASPSQNKISCPTTSGSYVKDAKFKHQEEMFYASTKTYTF
jgi:hypothetical protein